MALHAEDALGCFGIFEVLDLALAVPAFEAFRTECLLPCEDRQILDLVFADGTAVGAVVADEGAIAEEEEVCVRVEDGAAAVAAEAVQVPSVSRYVQVSMVMSKIAIDMDLTELECFAFFEYLYSCQ